MGLLTIRKLADKTVGERVRRYHPETGEAFLADPADELDDATEAVLAQLPAEAAARARAALAAPKPWPLAGVEIVDPPQETTIGSRKVAEGVREGWIELVGAELVHRPGGPAEEPWRHTHTFQHAAELVFHTVTGDVRYRVVSQPDKTFADDGSSTVEHFYGLALVEG